jgi:histidine ammonia-lyase
MNKSGTLVTSALLTLGLAAAAMAADMPKTAAPMSADSPAASGTTTDTSKPAKKHKK